MENLESPRPANLPIDTRYICPHLGVLNDPVVCFGYPDSGNYCFRAYPAEMPNLPYQDSICLTNQHFECPLFQNHNSGHLPRRMQAGTLGAWLKRLVPWIFNSLAL